MRAAEVQIRRKLWVEMRLEKKGWFESRLKQEECVAVRVEGWIDDHGEQCNAARSPKLYGCSLHVGTLPANALQDGKAATLAPSQRRGGSVSWRAYELRHDTMRYESRV